MLGKNVKIIKGIPSIVGRTGIITGIKDTWCYVTFNTILEDGWEGFWIPDYEKSVVENKK